jgi:hypothetical protein
MKWLEHCFPSFLLRPYISHKEDLSNLVFQCWKLLSVEIGILMAVKMLILAFSSEDGSSMSLRNVASLHDAIIQKTQHRHFSVGPSWPCWWFQQLWIVTCGWECLGVVFRRGYMYIDWLTEVMSQFLDLYTICPISRGHRRTLSKQNIREKRCCKWCVSNLKCWDFVPGTSHCDAALFTSSVGKSYAMLIR